MRREKRTGFFEEEPGSSTPIFYISVLYGLNTGFVRFKYGFCADKTHLFRQKPVFVRKLKKNPKTNLQICGFWMLLKALQYIHIFNPEIYPSTIFNDLKEMLEDRQVRQIRTKATCPAGSPQKATNWADPSYPADTPIIISGFHVEFFTGPLHEIWNEWWKIHPCSTEFSWFWDQRVGRRVVSVRILLGGCLVGWLTGRGFVFQLGAIGSVWLGRNCWFSLEETGSEDDAANKKHRFVDGFWCFFDGIWWRLGGE